MNKEHILFHLKAHEELSESIREIEQDPKYDFGEFVVAMGHLYHHINTAWNARDVAPENRERLFGRRFCQMATVPNGS